MNIAGHPNIDAVVAAILWGRFQRGKRKNLKKSSLRCSFCYRIRKKINFKHH